MVPFLSWCRYTTVFLIEDGERENTVAAIEKWKRQRLHTWKGKLNNKSGKRKQTELQVDSFGLDNSFLSCL